MADNRGLTTMPPAAALALLLLLAGCTTGASKHEKEFDKLLQALPGQYDNRAQANSDASGQHAAVALVINPVNSLAIGKVVMFERETAADDPRRILAQHIWTFELDKQGEHLVQSVYLFKEPMRWLHAVDDPYLMQSLIEQDLSSLTGCKLIWSKSDYGFAATTNAKDCSASAGAEGLLIEQSAELRGTDLLLNEQLSGPGGSFEGSADSASSYRFQRRSGPTQK
ncbi:MAG TPA: CpcT/CpeT family chromophore lyase [Steroidobacteraceae bacterium]|jgi:hypothetical protein|nr:CpcT/CpeT family chromophore lyase [Steroidobacteraceae bacterium]